MSIELCQASQCKKPLLARGLCSKHYYRVIRGQDLNGKSRFDNRLAIVEGDIAKLPLGINARLGYAIVDIQDKHLEKYNWSLGGRGYPTAYVDGQVTKLHQLIVGKPKAGFDIDHINRDKLDARRSNLRVVNHQINSINVGVLSTNTSGAKGVCWDKRKGKWLVQMRPYKPGAKKFLGYYDQIEDAIARRAEAEAERSMYLRMSNLK